MALTKDRKKLLIEKFGDGKCVTAGSALMAAKADLDGKFTLYPDDMRFLRDTSNCLEEEGTEESGTEETGGETSTTPTAGVLQRTSTDPLIPSEIKIGKTNWFNAEWKNIGGSKWIGVMGVKLTDKNGTVYTYEGDTSYPSSIAAGETKILWSKVPVPSTLATGEMSVDWILTEV